MDVKKLTPLFLLFLLPELQLSSIEITVQRARGTWAEAQAYCRRNHVDLFRITSSSDKSQIPDARGWIGLYRDDEDSEWKWSGREGIPADYDYTIRNRRGNCIFTRKGEDLLQTSNCSTERFFTCFEEKTVLVRENKTWEEALDHCRALGGGDNPNTGQHLSDLVSVSGDNLDFVRQVAEEAATDEVWVGLHFLAGCWWWVGGEPVKPGGLPDCPGDGACGVLARNRSEGFGIRNCTERRNFLCDRRPQTSGGS
ncbi:secretory phospholipase A2 receptor-like [Salarias fasciatus]|uniref:secretory phospholipase A2 receptor-like n=1 Tax=Salarias fasciatus TaxID=181472 RepID=UPI001176D001|nr:secretory phospholipase A2 receptor-like [Salarias fasciatus]